MRWRFILNIIGVLLFFFGLTMIFPLLVGTVLPGSEPESRCLESMGITVLAGSNTLFNFPQGQGGSHQPA